MIYFILQSIALLLLCFFVGYVIARFIKRFFYNRTVSGSRTGAAGAKDYAGSAATSAPTAGIEGGASLAANIKPDNLQVIEGIGPKMESVLRENGITTWSQLAAKSAPELQFILDKYGKRYQIIDPTIWLEQARLAAHGKVKELIELQKIDGVSKLENMMNENRNSGFAKYAQDDLKIVEGIGPKIEVLLNNSGINTWQALSETEVSKLRAILREAGPRYDRLAAPESWSLQAKLAANGDWSKLREFQNRLRKVRPARIDLASA